MAEKHSNQIFMKTKQIRMVTIDDLPPEILRNIFSLLHDPNDGLFFYPHLLIVAAVSKTWHINAFETFHDHRAGESLGFPTRAQDLGLWRNLIKLCWMRYMYGKQEFWGFFLREIEAEWVLEVLSEREMLRLLRNVVAETV